MPKVVKADVGQVDEISLSSQEDCGDSLAVNLWDLDGMDSKARVLVARLLDVRKGSVLCLDDKPDDERRRGNTLIQFECQLLQAAVALDAVRNLDRMMEHGIARAYLKVGGKAWRRLEDRDKLTVRTKSGEVLLNPKWFDVKVQVAPPKPRRL